MSNTNVMAGVRSSADFVVETNADDRLVVQLVLDGDVDSFGLLVERYQRPLYNAALRMVGDPDEAKDIVQSAFVRAYDKLDSYKPQYKFFSWLYRIMMNRSLNVLAQRKPQEPLDTAIVSGAPSPEQEMEASDLRARVQEALLQIAPHYREVIVLRHFLELSYREMAEALDVPEKTVKSRLFTARRLLSTLLED